MSKKLARLLKADIQESSDLKSIAAMLAGKGRGGDTMLAHITPKEVNLLKEAGGSGTVNPETGLLEFFDISEYGSGYGSEYDATIPSYIQPRQEGDLTARTDFDMAARQSPYYGEYGGTLTPSSPQTLTPSGIDPEAYYSGQENAAYKAATGGPVDGVYVPEFPPGMASRPDLMAAQRAAVPPGLAAPVPVQFGEKGVQPITPEQPGLSQRAADILKSVKESGQDVGKFIKENPELAKLGLSAAGALFGAQRAKGAAKDIQRSVAEQKAVGAPYQKRGQELVRAAEAGELTPQSQQALQAAQAQLQQGIAQRGGVGVAQAQAQMETLRQNLLQNQYNYGLQVAQIGDSIALGAIKTGMQMDQNLQQATTNFYTNLAAIAGGISPTIRSQT